MRLLKHLGRLAACRRANALAVSAASLPLIIGAAGLTLDTVQISLAKRQLQRAADTAALAGAQALVQNHQVGPSVARALELQPNAQLSEAPVVQNAPQQGAWAGNPRAVRVVLAGRQDTRFFAFFGLASQRVQVEATGAVVFEGQYCMISLEDGNATGVTFTGNTTVDLGCGVASNSRAAAGVSASGSARVTASPIMAVGGVPASNAYVQPTTLIPFAPQQANPFAGLPTPQIPDASQCQQRYSINPNRTETIGPTDGTWACFNGMDIKGNVTLRPGTYYINGDSFQLGSQAQISGTGVTIILTSTTAASNPSSVAGISMHAGAQLNLTSPSTGTYKGVLFYEDPRAPLNRSGTINGNSNTSIEGAIYFPRASLTFNGTTGMQTQCMQLVARRLTFSGNSRIQNVCDANGGARAFDGTQVRLVA
jgi:hypothetical protein